MSVVNISKLNIQDIVIKSPVKHTNNYLSHVLLNKKKLYIQLSNITLDNYSDKYQFIISEKQKKSIKDLDAYIIQNCSENSEKWFGHFMNKDQIQKNYISPVSSKNIFSLYTHKFRVFDNNNLEIDKNDLKKGDIVTIIISCNHIQFWSSKITINLQLLQLKQNINPHVDILFIDDTDDEFSDYTSAEDEEIYEKSTNHQ